MKEEEESVLKQVLQTPSFGYIDNFPKRDMWKEILTILIIVT